MKLSQQGMQRFQEMVGPSAPDIIETVAQICPDLAGYIVNFAYADLYSRPGLSNKTREVVAVACLVGQRNVGLPLKTHLKSMLIAGWEQEEILEVLLMLIGYVGFPSVVEAMLRAQEVFAEHAAELAA